MIFFLIVFFFVKDDDGGCFIPFYFLKMKEAWLNAPSLRDVFMVLKNLDLVNF